VSCAAAAAAAAAAAVVVSLQVDEVCGDDRPNIDQLRALRFTTRVVNESMRLYPQPPVLIRRSVEAGGRGGSPLGTGSAWRVG